MLDGWIGTEAGELSDESAVEIIKNWMSLSLQRSEGISDIHAKTGIQRKRLVKLFSLHCQDTPLPEEIKKISAATGYPAHDLVVQAADYLCPTVLDLTPSEKTVVLPRASRNALKLWLRSARRDNPRGRLTQMELADRIGRSHMSVAAWENPGISRIPKYKDICAIAEACCVEPPGPDFDVRQGRAIQAEVIASMASPTDLYEEILFNGCLLSRRAHAPSHAERNAQVFRARYGGQGDSESTLSAIGEIHGITRERIRQIVDKQLSFLPTTTVLTAQFDALAEACQELGAVAVPEAEERLRSLLGGTLSLQGAIDYGREVLGRSLPVQIIQIKKGDPVVLPGQLPTWFVAGISQSKAAIRHCGAAQINLVWALTMRQHGDWIAPDEFRSIIAHAPGFEWVDDDQAWYWFGVDGSANRVVNRAIDILSNAKGALDIEVIYSGVTRYSRGASSDVAGDAGIWPPMEVVQRVLAKTPVLVCQQGDDFRLANPGAPREGKKGVAQSIVEELKLRGGLASRSELHQSLVVNLGLNAISFSVALACSPLLRQVDRGIFAIRGWPINAARLTEAQGRVGTSSGPLVNHREVSVSSSGDVSWVNTVSKSSLSNLYAGVPAKAFLHLGEGDYDAGGIMLTLTETRMVGLIKYVVSLGGTAGTAYKVTANGRTRRALVEVMGATEDEFEEGN